MKRTILLGLGLISTLGITTAFAQQGQPGPSGDTGHRPRGRSPHGPGPLFTALDVDSNGTISAEEIAGAATALLDLDTNGDGALTRDELRPPPPAAGFGGHGERGQRGGARGRGGAGRGMPDADGDGFTSLEEFLAPPEAHFEMIDGDGDGFVSLDEYLAPAEEHFARLDSDGDNEIDPTEMQGVQRPQRPQQSPNLMDEFNRP